jgi:plastocyanin
MARRVLLAGTVSIALVLAVASVTSAAADERRVTMLDACDGPTFDAALQDPNACTRNGGVTFDEFITQLQTLGTAPAWRFAPTNLSLAAGGTIEAYNGGGEFHTFTEVAAFGGGCVPPLNDILGLTPVPECANAGTLFATTGAPPGEQVETAPLSPGTHRFECLIHPWMRSTVEVRG